MSWTDERVDLLKKLWGEGRTAAEIAKELGGVTRNAVIGKAHRLKLSGRASPIQQTISKKPANNAGVKPAQPVEKKAMLKKPMPVVADVVDTRRDENRPRIPLTDLESGQCRWPFGDPREKNFGFCGARSAEGVPYCSEHAHAAYQVTSRGRQLSADDLEREEAARAEKMALHG